MKRFLLLFALLSLAGSLAHAQYIYTHIEQNGTEIEKLGTASFYVSTTSNPQVVFTNGKAVMTLGNNTIATLPMSNNGEMVVELETTKSDTELNYLTKTPTESAPYVTIFSPFQLGLTTKDGEVYAPTYDAEKQTLVMSDKNKMAQYQIAPVETPLTICGTTAVTFYINTYTPTFAKEDNALSGSSLKIDVPTDGTVYTYGIGKEGPHKGEYGLFRYTGSSVNPGLAYLKLPESTDAKYIPISFDEEVTAIHGIKTVNEASFVGKRIENGRIVIYKDGKKYNLNGQETK